MEIEISYSIPAGLLFLITSVVATRELTTVVANLSVYEQKFHPYPVKPMAYVEHDMDKSGIVCSVVIEPAQFMPT